MKPVIVIKTCYIFPLLIGLLFKQSTATIVDDIVKDVKLAAENCAYEIPSKIISEAEKCIRDGFKTWNLEKVLYDRQSKILKGMSTCLEPFREVIMQCGNDNYIGILETLRAFAQESSGVEDFYRRIMTTPMICPYEKYRNFTDTVETCRVNEGIGDLDYSLDNIFNGTRFCDYADKTRVCWQRGLRDLSKETCPDDYNAANSVLEMMSKIARDSENSGVLSRCFGIKEELPKISDTSIVNPVKDKISKQAQDTNNNPNSQTTINIIQILIR